VDASVPKVGHQPGAHTRRLGPDRHDEAREARLSRQVDADLLHRQQQPVQTEREADPGVAGPPRTSASPS
jgi:hypothetical protein